MGASFLDCFQIGVGIGHTGPVGSECICDRIKILIGSETVPLSNCALTLAQRLVEDGIEAN